MKVITINGCAGAGKDEFVKQFKEISLLPVLNFSSVDGIKRIAKSLGWDGTKTPKNRDFLANLKYLMSEWNDLPMEDLYEKLLEAAAEYGDNFIMFVHVREPDEIERIKQEWDALTVCIRRPDVEKAILGPSTQITNTADLGVFDYIYDLYVWNDADVQNLREGAVCVYKYLEDNNFQ